MGELVISKLHSDVQEGSFDCGNESINRLVYSSYYPTLLQHGYAFQVTSQDGGILLGYYMIKFRNIKVIDCPSDISEYNSNLFNDCCALHISYIAVATEFQGHGIGSSILKIVVKTVLELSKKFPILLITIDALKEKYDWYKKLGFMPFREQEAAEEKDKVSMYIDCIEDRQTVYNYCDSLV